MHARIQSAFFMFVLMQVGERQHAVKKLLETTKSLLTFFDSFTS